MAILRSLDSLNPRGGTRKATSPLAALSKTAGAAVFGLAVLCLIGAMALVEIPQELVAPSTVLESAGMGRVLAAKATAEERERAYTRLAGDAHNALLALDAATEKKVKLANALDNLDRTIDQQSAKMSKDAARAEEEGDNVNDLMNKVHDHEHRAASDKRHGQTAERREKREEISLGEFTSQALGLSKKAASELKDAMRRQRKASELRQLARKHKEEASELKQHIRDVLRSQVASLSSKIDKSQRAALRATQAAKDDEKKYAQLQSRAAKHNKAAKLAQQNADQAALAAERADREAARLADEVSAELSSAQQHKSDLVRLLNSASNPSGATTLRTAIPSAPAAKTLDSADVKLGPTVKRSHATKEMREAAEKIRQLEREKRAEKAREEKEKQAERELEKELARQKRAKEQKIVNEGPVSKRPASRRYEGNFEAAMNYLNDDHLDAANGLDDHGRDAVGRPVEGRRAFVGVFGRTPQLDSMAAANLRQYQQDESEEDRANYAGEGGQREGSNPF